MSKEYLEPGIYAEKYDSGAIMITDHDQYVFLSKQGVKALKRFIETTKTKQKEKE